MHSYEIIRAAMLGKIADQIWTPADTLPHELDLAREFDVSRGTIRRAMADLVQMGLIERRRKSGTRVVARKQHSSTLIIPVVRKEIIAKGGQYGYKLLKCETGPEIVDMTGYFADAPLMRIGCLHLSDGRPYQLEDRLINLDAVPAALQTDFAAISPNEWLVERVPYSSVRTVLRAQPADREHADILKIAENAPLFIIERQTRLDSTPVTFVKMSHPAAGFAIVTDTGDG